MRKGVHFRCESVFRFIGIRNSALKVPVLLLVTFALSLPSFFIFNTLDAIETAVEEWRKKALPDIEKALLTRAQQEAVAKKNRP